MIGSLIGRVVRGRGGIVEHIESKEFILQLKTPRRDVIIHVKEFNPSRKFISDYECDDSEKDSYP